MLRAGRAQRLGAAGAQHLDDEFLEEVLASNSEQEARAVQGFLVQCEAFALMVGNERRALSEEEYRTGEKVRLARGSLCGHVGRGNAVLGWRAECVRSARTNVFSNTVRSSKNGILTVHHPSQFSDHHYMM